MTDELGNRKDTYFTSAAVAEELGLSRAAISAAVKRGALEPDAILFSSKASQIPIFRQATIERYKTAHLRKHGNRPASLERKDDPMERKRGEVRDSHLPLRMSAKEQELLYPGLLEALRYLDREIAVAEEIGLNTRELREKRERVDQIAEITKREVERRADVHDRITADTLELLLAAAELSARLDEAKLAEFAASGRSSATIEQLHARAKAKRSLFSQDRWDNFDWQTELRQWGVPEEANLQE